MDDPARHEEEAVHPPPPVDPQLLRQAVGWTREAGDLTIGYFHDQELLVDRKADGTPVTRADHEAEQLLRSRIEQAHPGDAVQGEEGDDRPGTTGRTWVIDPIDGTHAFSHGVGTYSNLLFLEDEHGPALGVINLPALGETVWAGRGRGCFLNGTPVSLTNRRSGRVHPDGGTRPGRTAERRAGEELRGRVLCVSGFHSFDPQMYERATAAGVILRTWGDAYGYALVATGRVHAMFDPSMEWWDLAAVTVVVQEAGGTITRRDGGDDLRWRAHADAYAHSAIASNGVDHLAWVELLSG